jgi:hypothetical protein
MPPDDKLQIVLTVWYCICMTNWFHDMELYVQEVDGLTTNGILIMHPQTSFCGADDPLRVTAEPGELNQPHQVRWYLSSVPAVYMYRIRCFA